MGQTYTTIIDKENKVTNLGGGQREEGLEGGNLGRVGGTKGRWGKRCNSVSIKNGINHEIPHAERVGQK